MHPNMNNRRQTMKNSRECIPWRRSFFHSEEHGFFDEFIFRSLRQCLYFIIDFIACIATEPHSLFNYDWLCAGESFQTCVSAQTLDDNNPSHWGIGRISSIDWLNCRRYSSVYMHRSKFIHRWWWLPSNAHCTLHSGAATNTNVNEQNCQHEED